MRLVADEDREAAKALQQLSCVRQVAAAVLDAGHETRIRRHEAGDDVMRDRHAGDLGNVIEVQAETRIRYSIGQPCEASVHPFVADPLEEEWWQHQRAGAD